MNPLLLHPSSSTSFFTPNEVYDLGRGLQLWRGYFQSIRPTIGKIILNLDITTGLFYKPGSLIDLCLEFISSFTGDRTDPKLLSPAHGFPERQRRNLSNFLAGARVRIDTGEGEGTMRVCKGLTRDGANAILFTRPDTGTNTLADYYMRYQNKHLRFPDIICAEFGNDRTRSFVPLELCEIPPGQLARKQLPPEKIPDMVRFSSQHPERRLRSIRSGVHLLRYGQSDYIRDFGGMKIHHQDGPLTVRARVLKPPTLRYGSQSRQPTITPSEGFWNM
ncbi:hypothetical protein V5O48_016395 [Marasmius crinis-equi]|uniref:PAZ domain-containing protein n=1 Tax=Marasmius crinis-equi TaxID=585013 RepID=A0ABR3ERV8_9AGAR